MPAIRVLYILPDMEPGGAQYTVLDMASYLDRDRFQARVCCLRGGGPLVGKLSERGIPFHLCYFGGWQTPLSSWRLQSLISELGAHVVHTHLPLANRVGRLAAVRAGTPVICAHNHDLIPEAGWSRRRFTRRLARCTDRIFCVSNKVREARLARGDEPLEKLVVFPNFVEPLDYRDDSDPAAVKAELGFPADMQVVGIVGRLHPAKNHELFLQSARRLVDEDPAIHFAIIGAGSERAALETRVQELGLSGYVNFTGNRNDMARVYRALDALVLCSASEGFGKVILEAQAAGVPVVALDGGGVAEVLQGGGGYLLNEATPQAFAVAIDHALQPLNRERLRAQAERNIAHFSASRLITELEDIYTDLCEQKHAFRHMY